MRRPVVLLLLSFSIPALLLADEQADAVKALEKIGVRVRVDKKSGAALKVDSVGKAVADDQLKHLAAMPKVKQLFLSGVKNADAKYAPKQIGDKGLAHIAELTELRELQIDGANVTDAGLKHLQKLKLLEILNLTSTRVSDEGMKILAELKKLRTVDLANTKVTDKGIAELKKALGPDANVRK